MSSGGSPCRLPTRLEFHLLDSFASTWYGQAAGPFGVFVQYAPTLKPLGGIAQRHTKSTAAGKLHYCCATGTTGFPGSYFALRRVEPSGVTPEEHNTHESAPRPTVQKTNPVSSTRTSPVCTAPHCARVVEVTVALFRRERHPTEHNFAAFELHGCPRRGGR